MVMHFADCWVDMTEDLHMTETQGSMQGRRTTDGVDKCHLDDLAQRKHVGIHDGPRGNKVDGLFGLNNLNKTTSQNSWPGPQNKKTTNKTSGKAKQVKQGTLGC